MMIWSFLNLKQIRFWEGIFFSRKLYFKKVFYFKGFSVYLQCYCPRSNVLITFLNNRTKNRIMDLPFSSILLNKARSAMQNLNFIYTMYTLYILYLRLCITYYVISSVLVRLIENGPMYHNSIVVTKFLFIYFFKFTPRKKMYFYLIKLNMLKVNLWNFSKIILTWNFWRDVRLSTDAFCLEFSILKNGLDFFNVNFSKIFLRAFYPRVWTKIHRRLSNRRSFKFKI